MSGPYHLLDLPFDCENAQAYLVHLLRASELNVKPTFELDSACASLSTGICSHDPDSLCSCRLVVLRVAYYPNEIISIILHSYDDKTEVFMEELEEPARPEVNNRIRKVLVF